MEIIRKAGMLIKVDSVQCSQEYRGEDRRMSDWKTGGRKPLNGQHLKQTGEDAAPFHFNQTYNLFRHKIKRDTDKVKFNIDTRFNLTKIQGQM